MSNSKICYFHYIFFGLHPRKYQFKVHLIAFRFTVDLKVINYIYSYVIVYSDEKNRVAFTSRSILKMSRETFHFIAF